MRIANPTNRGRYVSFRDGRQLFIPAGGFVVTDDTDVDFLDDNATLLGVFARGDLVLQNSDGSTYSGTALPTTPQPPAAAVGVLTPATSAPSTTILLDSTARIYDPLTISGAATLVVMGAVKGSESRMVVLPNGTNVPAVTGADEWGTSAGYLNTANVPNLFTAWHDGLAARYTWTRQAVPTAIGAPTPAPPAPTPSPSLTPGVVGFGDSTMYTVNAAGVQLAANLRAVNILATARGLTALNKGFSGTVLQSANSHTGSPLPDNGYGRYVADTLGTNARSVIVSNYGLNDLRYTGLPGSPGNMSFSNFITQYGVMVDAWKAAGMEVILASPAWMPDAGYQEAASTQFKGSNRTVHEQYVAGIWALAKAKGVKYAAVYENMKALGASQTDTDQIHPTTAGYATMGAAMIAAAVPTEASWPGASADVTAPTLTGATVNGVTVTLTYSETLATPAPAASSYSVTVASNPQVPTAATINGATVVLTLGTPALNAQTTTVAYTVPGSNPVRDTAGNAAAALTAQAVTNNTPATGGSVTTTAVNATTRSAQLTGDNSSETYVSSTSGGTTLDGIGLAGSFSLGTEAVIEAQYPNSTDASGVLVFDQDAGTPAYSTNMYLAQFIPTGVTYQSYNSQGTGTLIGFTMTPSATTRLRLRMAVDGTVTIETTTDNGSTWTVRYTFATKASSGTWYARFYVTGVRKSYQVRVAGIS